MNQHSAYPNDAREIVDAFATMIGGIAPSWRIKKRPDAEYLIIEFAEPNERLYGVLKDVLGKVPSVNRYVEHCTIGRRLSKPTSLVGMPEARMLQKELSESLTVDRNTFGEDFLSRYTTSVTNHETDITRGANFIVYGRRGSGKSSLLAYAMHSIRKNDGVCAWIALQTYDKRADFRAIVSIVEEIFLELANSIDNGDAFRLMAGRFAEVSELPDKKVEPAFAKLIPAARRLLGSISAANRPLTIFLDDLHVISEDLQPRLLASIYSMTRGNHCFIKASGIEQFTNIWDAQSRTGLEPPHDAQVLRLDYNLTMPDRSKVHIVSILDAHARFCGLPSSVYLCSDEVLSRLVLVAAAVPRDALSLFSQAITKSLVKGQKALSITAINAAASETIEEKLRDSVHDAPGGGAGNTQVVLDQLREFCVKKNKINAFLVRIDGRSNGYKSIQNLIALRFVHVLHEGITPHKVGERFVALMLDYGFYIGIRAAKSVRLFPDTPKPLAAKDLRKLPVFSAQL